MKIGMVSHWYDPEGGAAAGPGVIARALATRGHEVHVVTGFPIYPAGKVFDGYRIKPYQREIMAGGVTVHRCPIYPSHDTRALHRMANYASFAASGTVVSSSVLRSCDVAFVYSSPATAALPAVALRMLAGVPFVMQIQDLWPDTVTNSGFVANSSGRMSMTAVLDRFCNMTYRRARSIAVTSPGMANLLIARGVDAMKISFVPNWADEVNFFPQPMSPVVKKELGLVRPFIAMYAGNLGEMQSLDSVIGAARMLRSRHDIEFALVGTGVVEHHLRYIVAENGLDNVSFISPQPFSRMSEVLATGDVQLVTLKDVPLYHATTPSKIQASLAAGRPIVAAVAGDGGRIVTEANAGRAIAAGDPKALADAISDLADMSDHERTILGQNGRAHYMHNFCEEVVGDRLVELLAAAADGSTR